MNARSRIALLALAAAVAATPAATQRRADPSGLSRTRGLSLGIAVSGGGNWSGSDFQSSAGTELTAAYGINSHLSFFARKTVAYQMSQESFGARYTLRSGAAQLRPYLEGAYTYSRIGEWGSPDRGAGMSAALGAEYFVTPRLAMDVGLRQTLASAGGWTEPDGRIFESRRLASTRLVLGFRFHP